MLISPHVDKLKETISLMNGIKINPTLKKVKFVGSSTFHTKYTSSKNISNKLDSLVIATPYFLADNNQGFDRNFSKEWGIPLDNWRTPMSYAALEIITKNFSNDSRTTRKIVLDGMSNVNKIYSLSIGFKKFSFDSEGEGSVDDPVFPKAQLIQLNGTKFGLKK